jgi:hypothetical protein
MVSHGSSLFVLRPCQLKRRQLLIGRVMFIHMLRCFTNGFNGPSRHVQDCQENVTFSLRLGT